MYCSGKFRALRAGKGNDLKEKNHVVQFESAGKWELWLERNYGSSPGVWLRIFKKDSDRKSVTYSEAVDTALCYGWIDGQKDKYDGLSWIQRFTPRRAKSGWSKNNTRRADQLIKAGKIRPAGLKEVEQAKQDGRWAKAYDSPGKASISDDFMRELDKNRKAKAFFETLNKANTYAISYRLQTAKKAETREKHMKNIIAMLSRGQKFHP